MLKHFKYTKESGDISDRVACPLYIIDGDKMLMIDVTPFNDVERQEVVQKLEEIHQEMLRSIRQAGFSDRYRSFFLDQMS